MKIQVTQEHIERGEQADCIACPVALAVHDAGIRGARVYLDSFAYNPDGGPVKWVFFSEGVAEKIRDFDYSRGMLPFEFEVEGI